MSISAVSSVSGGAPLRPVGPSAAVRGPGADEAARRVAGGTKPEGARTEGPEVAGPAGEAEAPNAARLLALDPRGPESIVPISARASEGEKAIERQADKAAADRENRQRLADLLGEKAALERGQSGRQGERNAEVSSLLSQLKSRDAEVRAHEAAHIASGGRYVTGGATFTYERGPDGANYAVGGEVGIDTSPVPGDPEATAEKMRIIRAAALAPGDPSSADLAVAAAASAAEAAALAELAAERADAMSSAVRASTGGAGERAGGVERADSGAAGTAGGAANGAIPAAARSAEGYGREAGPAGAQPAAGEPSRPGEPPPARANVLA